jgi:hypothetical protein
LRVIIRVILFLLVGMFFSFHPKPVAVKNKAQLVLCVDFSKSAKQISDAVSNNFWEFYTEFENSNPNTKLELAIVGFSSKVFGKENGYVKVLLDFEDDPASYFEYVNKKTLTSSLADNQVGTALSVAVKQLSWDKNPNVKKQIFAIGNGTIKDEYGIAKKACEKAKKKNIDVNVLYVLHKKKDAAFSYWQHLTELSGGRIITVVSQYFNENVSGKIKTVLQRISVENEFLNSTYIPFNNNGMEELDRIKMIDAYATTAGVKVIGTRSIYKMRCYYKNQKSKWDLVDLYDGGKVNYKNLVVEKLPLFMQKMSLIEIKKVLKEKSKNRKLGWEIISDLNHVNQTIRAKNHKIPGYKLDLSSTILKAFTESGI